jgi:hypothetical protein
LASGSRDARFGCYRHPYSFYALLRWICCAAFAYAAFMASEKNRVLWLWIFGVLAVLFNPIIPVHLQRDTWQIVDWGALGVIVIAVVAFWRDSLLLVIPRTSQNSGSGEKTKTVSVSKHNFGPLRRVNP